METISFNVAPYKINGHLVLPLPQDASSKLPSRSQVMVKGTVDGYEFQTALEPDGNGSHWLDVNKDMQAAGVSAGKSASLEIEATKDWPEPEIPQDWQAALDADPKVYAFWNKTTPLARWEWLRWIDSTKEPSTRQRRIEVSCSKLLHGEKRPCCFNRSMNCVPDVSKSGVLLRADGTLVSTGL